ncbi:thuringiensis toxin domain-containing protein [Rhizoctonia solani]|uniref:Thuringiensis toxin domain-containing protein n=1 Tax=Rhizoctonia solani TaxID=456999 RepID=A0A8H8P8F6_9AGAM|nr:thuringiensis toxin domain-containing protein [Rhizoctonia solani]QRW25718.1 thuringiensis toxin domain-containing protein [Rhizoctonia solani]
MSDALFDEFGTLPGHLFNSGKQALKFFGYFLNGNTQQLDWNNQLAQESTSLQTVAEKTAQFLGKVGSGSFDKDSLSDIIQAGFTSLEQKEDSGFAHYEKEGDKSAFTYRLVFEAPNPDIPSDFYALVVTHKLIADITEKWDWFGLGPGSTRNFSAEVNVMKLACNQNFVAGPKPPM